MKTFTGTSYFNAILIALLWVIPVTSVHAQSTERQCVDKMNAFSKSFLVFKNGYFQDDKPAENNYRYNAYGMNLYSGECAHFPHSKNTFENYNGRLQEQIEICIKANLGPTCGQPAVNIVYPASAPATDARSQQSDSSSQQTTANNDSPPIRKLTAAERKEQQTQQKADDLSTKSQQRAQETQAKADSARQGKRKKHDPAAEAHHCIKVNEGGLFGSMDNKCNFKIWYVDCGYRPTENSWLKYMACENQKFGLSTVGPNKRDPSHTRKVEKMYWFACKDPARPVDYSFIEGSGIQGRCFDTANSVFD